MAIASNTTTWSRHRKGQAHTQLMLPKFSYLLDVATKEACKQSHMPLGNNSARSLQTVSLPHYSDWNVCLWILHCILDFWTAVWKHHTSCVLTVCIYDLKPIPFKLFIKSFTFLMYIFCQHKFCLSTFMSLFSCFSFLGPFLDYLHKMVHWQQF